MCYCPTPTLHLNLALTGDGAFQLSPQKTHTVWFISILNYGDTENVLINHLLLVIPMSYPCHYTNLCPHKPHKHAHTHTRARTHLFLWIAGTFHRFQLLFYWPNDTFYLLTLNLTNTEKLSALLHLQINIIYHFLLKKIPSWPIGWSPQFKDIWSP